jgi:hypothetical protein
MNAIYGKVCETSVDSVWTLLKILSLFQGTPSEEVHSFKAKVWALRLFMGRKQAVPCVSWFTVSSCFCVAAQTCS